MIEIIEKALADTNIAIYAHDPTDPYKRAKAIALLQELLAIEGVGAIGVRDRQRNLPDALQRHSVSFFHTRISGVWKKGVKSRIMVQNADHKSCRLVATPMDRLPEWSDQRIFHAQHARRCTW